MRTRLLGPLAGAVALSAVACLSARAGVNVEINPNAKVAGTLDGDGDTDTFRFDATAGATLSIAVKAKKKAKLDFTLELTLKGGDPIDLTGASAFQDKDKSIKVKGLLLAQNGRYVLRVGGVGEGEYALKVKAKPQKAFKARRMVAGSALVPFAFSAPRGAKVVIKTKQSKGSAALPMLDGGSVKGTSSSLTLLSLAASGLQEINVNNTSDTDGDLDISVKVTPKKAKAEKVDVRARALGGADGGGTAFSATVRATDGGEVAIPFTDPLIGGAGVLVPAGALAVDARISVTSAAVLVAPDPETQQSSGPAIRFGPDGLQFSENATVTIPWDPSAFPIGVDPVTALRVIRVQSDGTETVIIPTFVDVENGLCTVPTSGFSTFMAFSPRGTPDLEGVPFWVTSLKLCVNEDDLFNADSRERQITFFAGTLDFGAPDTPGGIALAGVESTVTFSHDSFGGAIVSPVELPPMGASGSWFYFPDGQSIGADFQAGPETDLVDFYLAEDGSALVSREQGDSGDPCVSMDVAIRRSATPLTAADVAGDYFLGGSEVRGTEQEGVLGPVILDLASTFGSLTLRQNGTWTVSLDTNSQRFDPARGIETGSFKTNGSGTFRFAGAGDPAVFAGSLVLASEEDGDFLRVFPSADGQTLLAVSEQADIGGQFYVGTRMAKGLTTQKAAGDFAVRVLLPEDLVTYTVFDGLNNIDIPDFGALGSVDQLSTLAPNGDANFFNGIAKFVARDPAAGPGGVSNNNFFGFTFEDRLAIAANGRVTTNGEDAITGAFRGDGRFAFWVEDLQRGGGPSLNVALRLPPSSGIGEETFPPLGKR